jgi:hypothetical protein
LPTTGNSGPPTNYVDSVFIPIHFVFVVITTAVLAILTTAVLMTLFATPLLAILATLLAAAVVPNRVSHHVQGFDGGARIVALDDKFATSRTLFRGLVANDDAQARTRVQGRREGVVDQLPVMVLALERNAGHMELAVAHITDGYGALGTAAGLHSAEARRAGDRELARRCVARDGDGPRASWVVAEDRD